MPYPIWSVFTHRLRKLITAVEGHYRLFWLLGALLSGRFLLSRGAVFPALADGGLPADAVRRSGAALA
jgi:hypothetical protein